jgi:PKD repeat protein/V8-like Glu-specific endopeptidase
MRRFLLLASTPFLFAASVQLVSATGPELSAPTAVDLAQQMAPQHPSGPAPLLIGRSRDLPFVVDLPPLSDDERRSFEEKRRVRPDDPPRPELIGLGRPLALRIDPTKGTPAAGRFDRSPDGATRIWSGRIRSEGSAGLRLKISAGGSARGAFAWVYGENEGPLGPIPIGEEPTWTPTIFGESVWLEIRLPEAPAGTPEPGELRLTGLSHLVPVAPESHQDPCMVDLPCRSSAGVDSIAAATATLHFMGGDGGWYVCSGTLLNVGSTAEFEPYLLTANHCFSTQSSASTLEAYFDYRATSCNGSVPSLSSVPRVVGATLLATGTASDFTFVRLSSTVPGGTWGRSYLGWTTTSPNVGDTLYRVAYPHGESAVFTQHVYEGTLTACSGWDNHHKSRDVDGATAGGSSGSGLVNANTQVVGDLSGSCGSNVADDCDVVNNRTADGKFGTTFPSISQWLNPTVTLSADFTWSPTSPTAGQTVQFQDSSAGSPTSWSWSFGDGGSSTLQNPSHPFASAGTFSVKLTASKSGGSSQKTKSITVTAPTTSCSGSYVYFVPAGAHASGTGAMWVTDLGLLNEGSATATVNLLLLERDQANSNPAGVAVTVGAGAQAELADVFLNRFGRSSVAAAIRICSNQPLVVSSRTYNLTTAGTYGQGIPGQPVAEAIASGGSAKLPFLFEGTSYRTNVGFVNTTANSVTVAVDFYGPGGGAALGTKSYPLRAYEYIQRSKIFTEVTGSEIRAGYLVVRPSGGAVFAYASMVDNDTGDPTYLQAD